jgi:hypothetical protein
VSAQDLADLAVAYLKVQGVDTRGWNALKTGADEYRLRVNLRQRMRFHGVDRQSLIIDVFMLAIDGGPVDESSLGDPSRSL